MFKSDLINVVSEKTGIPKRTAAACIDAVFETITDVVVEGNSVSITGFGKFVPKTRQAHDGRNPQTGEKISIPEKVVPSFKAGKLFREKVRESAGV